MRKSRDTNRTGVRLQRLESRRLLSGGFVWGWGIGTSTNGQATPSAVEMDSNGNTILLATFTGTIDADPATDHRRDLVSKGGRDVLVAKYDPQGALLWARSFGGAGDEEANDLALDSLGNVYLTGSFYGTVDFCPTAAVWNEISRGGGDIYATVLSMNGGFHMVRAVGGKGYDSGRGIAVDQDTGEVAVVGTFKFQVNFGQDWFRNPDIRVPDLPVVGGSDGFLWRFDSQGFYTGAKRQGGPNNDTLNEVALHESSVFTAGEFDGQVLVVAAPPDNVSPEVTTTVTSNGGRDVLVCEWTEGIGGWHVQHSWQYGSAGQDYANGLAVNDQGAYVLGTFDGSLNGLPSRSRARDLFVARAGTEMARIGGVADDIAGDLALDSAGNVLVCGAHRGTLGIYPSSGQPVYFAPMYRYDMFVVSFTSALQHGWSMQRGDTSSERALAIAARGGHFTLAGAFDGQTLLDPDQPFVPSRGQVDILVAQYLL